MVVVLLLIILLTSSKVIVHIHMLLYITVGLIAWILRLISIIIICVLNHFIVVLKAIDGHSVIDTILLFVTVIH